ncbi:glycoside hydrolase family 16 protein [Acidomyces richmondensis BFW]|nr:MAG: glycoside hydrolase family 16 protein [Acidomyces sp. 'richmondensis']KYG47572.1 glycoside hydrolase family 16 protein [Acidomyces richmondensis BFW]
MRHTFNLAAALAATFALSATASTTTCGPNNPCPSSIPCCSQYGQCGVGAYCLGGCDPRYSFDLDSCVAAPTCQSANYELTSLSDVQANTVYLGNSSAANWVSSGTPVVYKDESILLTMAPNTVGSLLMSTHYVWYGRISCTLSTSQGAGVVTAFIMMSDVHDEIDFEFVGVDLEHAQSNYYFQGIDDYHNEENLTVPGGNTREEPHTYTIDWQPDTLTWYVDGTPMRTLNRNTTYNETTQQYHYPQTPSRVELSLWPAGDPSNSQGTIDWAGGVINWDSPYMQNGYYYAIFYNVTVECYSPPPGFSNNFGDKAYYYTSTAATNNTVAIGNNNTILDSFFATGDDPTVGASASASAATSTNTPNTVPGISGGGNAGNSGTESSSSSSSSSGGSSSSNSGSGSSSFQQGTGGTSQAAPKVVAGSAVALLGFFAACLFL